MFYGNLINMGANLIHCLCNIARIDQLLSSIKNNFNRSEKKPQLLFKKKQSVFKKNFYIAQYTKCMIIDM